MPRCVASSTTPWPNGQSSRRQWLRGLGCGALLLAALGRAQAQPVRRFSAQTLRGELVVTAPPQVLLNGQPAQLSPGARIRGSDHMMALSGTLVNQRLLVHYTLDTGGQLRDVWVLTPAEAARPWPVTPAQAQAWQFNPDTQTWSR